jgi:DNA-binding NtrC family response regulator
MPKGTLAGTILIGSSETKVKDMLKEFVASNFSNAVMGVAETSDLLLEAIGREVDVVILDTNLKGLPIAKTVQLMKKCKPGVPVIVISDDYTVATGSRIMEQGVFYYMYKPVEMESLREIISSALKKRAKEEAQERR